MSLILCIETATQVCSVALSDGDRMIAIRETTEKNAHSRLLTVFIEEIVAEAGISLKDLDAIAVSEGPGSYTGLRIGVSAAKGLCYATSIPLIAIGTLQALAAGMQTVAKPGDILIPTIDARRMEIYTAVYDTQLNPLINVAPVIVDRQFFTSLPPHSRVILAGDGAAKCLEIAVEITDVVFAEQIRPSAGQMTTLAHSKFLHRDFVDTAYFEPFYMKEFLAGIPVVKGLL